MVLGKVMEKVEIDELLKKRDELLKYKEEIIKVKSKYHRKQEPDEEQEQELSFSSFSSLYLKLEWDDGVLIVLKSDELIIKSFYPIVEKKTLKLPEIADINTTFKRHSSCIAVSYSCKKNYIYSSCKTGWIPIDIKDSRILFVNEAKDRIRLVLFNDEKKVITVIDSPSTVIKVIEDVNKVILNSNSNGNLFLLLIKFDGSLTVL